MEFDSAQSASQPDSWLDRFMDGANGQRLVKLAEEHPYLQSVPYWIAATLVGLAAWLYAELFSWCSHWAVGVIAGPYRFLIILLAPACFLGAWWMVKRYAPTAGGSGIPQVMAAINMDVSTPRRMVDMFASLKVAGVKVASSLLCALGGGVIGREGPTIQIAASIFHGVGKISRRVWPATTHQPWIIAGGAAGIAAAFNTPLGGIVFAIEELAPEYFNRFKTVLLSAVIIAGMVAQSLWGPYLYFGFPHLGQASIWFPVWALLVGAICGLLGGLFVRLLLYGMKQVSLIPGARRMQFVAAVGLVIAVAAVAVGPELLGGGDELVRNLLADDAEGASWSILLGRYVATLLTYVTGVAGGVFAPSLAIGAAVGSKLDSFVNSGNVNLMILLGMSGFLSAVTRAPFTSLVLVFEMTNQHQAIFPLMLASVSAHTIARQFNAKSFYVQRMEFFLAQMERSLEQPSLQESTGDDSLSEFSASVSESANETEESGKKSIRPTWNTLGPNLSSKARGMTRRQLHPIPDLALIEYSLA